MLCFPNCKINLGLYVTGKRADGYHNIETVFYPVMLQDVLEIVPADRAGIYLAGLAVAGDKEDNLVWKAYELLRQQYPDKVGTVAIYLQKNVPMGAGLGGGSADGAFMLKLLNDYCQLQLDNDTLAGLALQLGSDCPFFIYNTPQMATGRGEVMKQVIIDLSAYSMQVVCPELHVSTKDAFTMMQPKPAAFDLAGLCTLPVEQWRLQVSNDFEGPVFSKHPELAQMKQQLYEQGAVYASMSGSGSALYGIFPKNKKATITSTVAFKDFFIR